MGAAAPVTEPSPTSSKPAATRSRSPSRRPVNPSVSATAAPANTDAIRRPARHGGRHAELASHIRQDRSQHEDAGLGGEHSQKQDQGGLRAGTKRHERTVRPGRPRAIGDTTQPMQLRVARYTQSPKAQPTCEKRAAAAARAALPETRSFAYTLER